MMQDNNFFDPAYMGGETTEVEKPEVSQVKKFLSDPLHSEEIKQYGISKPTRIVIRGRVARNDSTN